MDPVNLFPEHLPRPQNSVTKFISDLYETCPAPSTPDEGRVNGAGVFYLNDERVLIDILIRQLGDLTPGNEVSKVML